MSVARVTYVTRSRKPYKCEKCGDEIPKGSPYKWFTVGFRSRYPHVRCTKFSCEPKPSERESSQMATVLAAMESAQDQIGALDDSPEIIDQFDDIRSGVVEALNEVADIYEEADQNFGGGGNTEMGEKAEELRDAANTLESESIETGEPDFNECQSMIHDETDDKGEPREAVERGDTDECSECAEILSTWAEDTRQAMRDALEQAVTF